MDVYELLDDASAYGVFAPCKDANEARNYIANALNQYVKTLDEVQDQPLIDEIMAGLLYIKNNLK